MESMNETRSLEDQANDYGRGLSIPDEERCVFCGEESEGGFEGGLRCRKCQEVPDAVQAGTCECDLGECTCPTWGPGWPD